MFREPHGTCEIVYTIPMSKIIQQRKESSGGNHRYSRVPIGLSTQTNDLAEGDSEESQSSSLCIKSMAILEDDRESLER